MQVNDDNRTWSGSLRIVSGQTGRAGPREITTPRKYHIRDLKAIGAALLKRRDRRADVVADNPSPRMAKPDTSETALGKSIRPLARSHRKKSGVVALPDGRDAFAVRAGLADAAERTLDVQYYIWHDDMSGTLLFDALHRAADRGVRVRMLLDDNNTTGLDSLLAALNAHPNMEIRLFNPFVRRRWRVLDYLTDFARLNRRMHNKSFIVDNQVAIVGGRNVGDEYFEANDEALFVDLDIMAIGPIVDEVSRDFDRYWASDSSLPAERVLRPIGAAARSTLTANASRIAHEPGAREYMQALVRQPFVRELLAGRLTIDWAPVHLISDDPAKGLGRAANDTLVWPRLTRILGEPTRELDLVSPYFVPTAAGVESFLSLSGKGVQVTLLTNSLEATDVAAVHAGYAKWRKPLLENGVSLFEMKRTASPPSVRDHGLTGNSGSSLHAKTFSIDRSRVFVGSFNFDPRSLKLNTEMGFVIESPALARNVANTFGDTLATRAYEVRPGRNGKLQWVEQRGGREIVHEKEPGAGFWRRAAVAVIATLPVEWLL